MESDNVNDSEVADRKLRHGYLRQCAPVGGANHYAQTKNPAPFYIKDEEWWIPHRTFPGLMRCPKCLSNDVATYVFITTPLFFVA
jgi:hypothetical protein